MKINKQIWSNVLQNVKVKKINFKKWNGKRIKDSYGSKTVIDFEGKPVFAEIAFLRLLKKKGWEGVWVDTFSKKFRQELPEIDIGGVNLPAKQQQIMDKISGKTGFKGCWDILAWKEDKVMFVELKRKSKDKIRETQIRWFEMAKGIGVSEDCFCIVEWDIVEK